MTLIKTSLLNGIAVIVKMITLLGLNKILAIYVGPSGYATVGQFQNIIHMITTLSGGAINTGVTKYTAEYYENEKKQHAVWRTAGTISLIGSLIVAGVVFVFNRTFAEVFLKDKSLSSIFTWFSIALVLYVFNTLLLAILNGKKDIQRYVVANIVGSVFALFVTALLAIQYGLYGALVAISIYQSLTFFVTIYICKKAFWFKPSYLFGSIDLKIAKNLAKYTAMGLTSAACIPLSHLMIRNHLGTSLGWDVAGYWEAMWRFSAAYLMLITTTLSVYYLPRLSELQKLSEIKREILHGYYIILPIALVCGFCIYTFRDALIHLLFSESFEGMRVLFFWQIIGDVLKIASWLLSYLMIAKGLSFLYIFTEILFSAFFFTFIYYGTEKYGIEAASIAHAVVYAVYLPFLYLCLRKMLSN